MTENPRPVIGYIRVGSPDPNTLSGEHQKRRLTEWAAETGHEIVEWVEEYGAGRAGPAFDRAVELYRGRLIVAVDQARIARDVTVLQAKAEQVRAAGGGLGFVDGWQELSWQDRLTNLIADYEAGRPRVNVYGHRSSRRDGMPGAPRQASAGRDTAEQLGLDVHWVDED